MKKSIKISDVLRSIKFNDPETACDAHKIIGYRLLDVGRIDGPPNLDDMDCELNKIGNRDDLWGWFENYDICDEEYIFVYFFDKISKLIDICYRLDIEVT